MRAKRVMAFVILSSFLIMCSLGNSACSDRNNNPLDPFSANQPAYFTPLNPVFTQFILTQIAAGT
ncbi:MAG TPA: hypothetical protein V6D17_10430 [Candidatus Obscuribacterales bacterium]